MAGIYIHIPFCKQACTYCDFYFSVSTTYKSRFLSALEKEIVSYRQVLSDEKIETIYFGGGTPSLLKTSEMASILRVIFENYYISNNAEITIEANPDDLTVEYLEGLKKIGINRLSIGVQSFHDDELKMVNRRHNASQAYEAIRNAKRVGFANISADLIYALPNQDHDKLLTNLETFSSLDIAHISIYQLTYEQGTQLMYRLKKNRVIAISEEESVRQYETIMDFLDKKGYDQYEISNFARDGMISRHNSSYWNGIPYLGFGPSAHSYFNQTRRWNIRSLQKYLLGIEGAAKPVFEYELLSTETLFNEYILTGLRTKRGIDLQVVKQRFGELILNQLITNVKPWIRTGHLEKQNQVLTLTRPGKMLADRITSDLFAV